MTWTRIAAAVAFLVLGAACGTENRGEPLGAVGEEPGYSDDYGTPLKGGKTSAPRERCSANCAPDFSVTTFTGERFALAEHHGKVVVLNFWESW